MERKPDPRIAYIADIHGHAKGEHKPYAEERPIPYTARMLFLWFFHACRRFSPRFLMVADHMNYLTFEDPAAVNLVRRALKLAQAGDLYGAAETAGVELGHAAVVSEGLKRGMRYSIGAEIDNDPRCRPDAQNIVDAMKPDGMIRSIHFLSITHPQHGENWMWAFDNPEFRELYDVVGTANVWELYIATLLDAIEKLPGTIVGHFYVPAKFGHWPDDGTLESYEDRFVAACAERGMAIEVNSRYFYKYYLDDEAQRTRYKTAYARLLRKAKAANVMVAVGSDAHSPKDQGHAFETILEMLDEAEINEIAFPIAGRLARVALRATDETPRQPAAAPVPTVAGRPTVAERPPTQAVALEPAAVPEAEAVVADAAKAQAAPEATGEPAPAPAPASETEPEATPPAADASVEAEAAVDVEPDVVPKRVRTKTSVPVTSAPALPEADAPSGDVPNEDETARETEPQAEAAVSVSRARDAARVASRSAADPAEPAEPPAETALPASASPGEPIVDVGRVLVDVARSVATRAIEAASDALHPHTDAAQKRARKSPSKPVAKAKAATPPARAAAAKPAPKPPARKPAAPAAKPPTSKAVARSDGDARAPKRTAAPSAAKSVRPAAGTAKSPAKRTGAAAKKAPAKAAKRPVSSKAAPAKAPAKKASAKKSVAKSASKAATSKAAPSKAATKKTVAKKKSRTRR
ncbi:MAG: hypothetical protein NVSMB21_07930 [Vulcanimicrobiaceae bacterium]